MSPEPVKKPAIQKWHPMLALEMEDFCRDFNAIKYLVESGVYYAEPGVAPRIISDVQATQVMQRWEEVVKAEEASGRLHPLTEKEKDPVFPDVCYEPTRPGCIAVANGLNAMLGELCKTPRGRHLVEALGNHRSMSIAGKILVRRIVDPWPEGQNPNIPMRDFKGPNR